MPPPVPAGIPSELLERRPDLVAAERRVASAFYMIQSAQAARHPRIALTLSGGHSSNDLFYLLNVNPWFWQAGANFLAPLYTGGALKAQVTIATAQQQAALSLYGQTALRAFNEVETALANEQLLAEQQRHLEIVLQQDTEALRLGRIRYNVGATDLLSVLDLQTKQLNTQTDLISLRSDRLSNRVGLYLALGGGFTQTSSP
jgi:outer membrane protein, multidrug efflux system